MAIGPRAFLYRLRSWLHRREVHLWYDRASRLPVSGLQATGKYYIGNANLAPMVSTFAKIAGTVEYVFFSADSPRPNYQLLKNVTASQNYVAQYALCDYPVTEAEILSRGEEAWNSALNTVNVGKFTWDGRPSAYALMRFTKRSAMHPTAAFTTCT